MVREPREVLKSEKVSTYELGSGEPMHMDLTTVFADGRSPLFTKAIFAVHGDRLTYCVGAPGQPRPESFVTRSGDGATLVVLRRIQ